MLVTDTNLKRCVFIFTHTLSYSLKLTSQSFQKKVLETEIIMEYSKK